MIVKKLKRTSFKKSKSTIIGGLVDYILAEHDDNGKGKLAFAGSKNFLTTTVAAQKREMISLAEESIQSRMPVTHWILSWQENEQPTHEQVDETVSLFLRGMGLAEHQTIYALHKNTGNYHLHIVVNRTHPYTQKLCNPIEVSISRRHTKSLPKSNTNRGGHRRITPATASMSRDMWSKISGIGHR